MVRVQFATPPDGGKPIMFLSECESPDSVMRAFSGDAMKRFRRHSGVGAVVATEEEVVIGAPWDNPIQWPPPWMKEQPADGDSADEPGEATPADLPQDEWIQMMGEHERRICTADVPCLECRTADMNGYNCARGAECPCKTQMFDPEPSVDTPVEFHDYSPTEKCDGTCTNGAGCECNPNDVPDMTGNGKHRA
jgi:hypothetical protein